MYTMNADTKTQQKNRYQKKEPNESSVIKCIIHEIKNSLNGIIEDWEKIRVSELDRSAEIIQSEKVKKEILRK